MTSWPHGVSRFTTEHGCRAFRIVGEYRIGCVREFPCTGAHLDASGHAFDADGYWPSLG